MSKVQKFAKRYRGFLVLLTVNVALLFLAPTWGWASLAITQGNLVEMLSVLPPVFVLLGLLDVWVERETMMRLMGKGSGMKGGVIAFIMGAAAAGPLYAAFPVAGVLMKKGVSYTNVFLFIGSWSTTKIPLLLFEAASLGWSFTALRLGCNLVGIVVIALVLEKSLSEQDRKDMETAVTQR